MSRKISIIPKATIARMIMNAGAKRVSMRAAEIMSESIKEISLKIATKSVEIAKHSGRKTVNGEDVKLATR